MTGDQPTLELLPKVRERLADPAAARRTAERARAVLDELNSRIEDADAAIGPSYLMDPRIYQRDDGMERVWQYWIMPLLADQFYGQTDLEERYGLAALRRAVGTGGEGQPPEPQDGDQTAAAGDGADE